MKTHNNRIGIWLTLMMLLCLISWGVSAQELKVIEVPYRSSFMLIDGDLDERAWEEATVLRVCADPIANGCDNDPDGVSGQPSEGEYYEILFLHDRYSIYMGVRAYVPYVAAADPGTVFSTGVPELLIKVHDESKALPYRLTWIDPSPGAGPGVTQASMWFGAPVTGEWAYALLPETVPNSGEPGTGYIFETTIGLWDIGYHKDPEAEIPFSLVLFNFAGPVGGKVEDSDARWSRYELGAFRSLAESSEPTFTHAWRLQL